jgi:hypothetical protein
MVFLSVDGNGLIFMRDRNAETAPSAAPPQTVSRRKDEAEEMGLLAQKSRKSQMEAVRHAVWILRPCARRGGVSHILCKL